MKCRLTRITENDHTRTKVIEGQAYYEPTLGARFAMTADPLDPAYDFRGIWTTPIQEMKVEPDGKSVRFKTLNTEYVFEPLDG